MLEFFFMNAEASACKWLVFSKKSAGYVKMASGQFGFNLSARTQNTVFASTFTENQHSYLIRV